MPKPNLDDYVDVATRLQRFREKYPNGSIETAVYHDDGKAVRVRAQAYGQDNDTARPLGTGHAEEIRGEGPVNKTSALENCETSAVGRALAMAGFEVSKGVASKQEVEQAQQEEQRQAEEPKQNGGIPLTRLRELRQKINSQAPSRDELGLMLVTVGIEHGPVIDALANQHITQAQAKRAVEIITPEQADALTGALDTGELS